MKSRDRIAERTLASEGNNSLSLWASVRNWIVRASKDVVITWSVGFGLRVGVDLLWCSRGLWSATARCICFSFLKIAGVAGVVLYAGEDEEASTEDEDVSPSSLSALASSTTPSTSPSMVSICASSAGALRRGSCAERLRLRRRLRRVAAGTAKGEALSDVVELFPRSSLLAASFSRSAAIYVNVWSR